MLAIEPILNTERNVMYVNFAAGTLIVLGILHTVLGVLAGGSVTFTLIGLGAIGFAGILGILDRHVSQ